MSVRAVGQFTKVNPSSEAFVRFRVKNRLRYTLSIVMTYGRGPAYFTYFEEPRLTLFPQMTNAFAFDLPGHDLREVELRMRAKGVVGATSVQVSVIANGFRGKFDHMDSIPLEATQDVSA